MSRQRLIHQWIGLILITWILTGCIAPAAPARIPPTVTQAAVVPTTAPTSAPPTSTPTLVFTLATSVMDIVGVWHSPAKGLYFQIFEDGTFHQAHSIDSLDTDPYAISEIWFEGTQMYLKEKAVVGVPSCGDDPAIYEVRLLSGGHIQIVKVQDKCPPRTGDTALKLEPVH